MVVNVRQSSRDCMRGAEWEGGEMGKMKDVQKPQGQEPGGGT